MLRGLFHHIYDGENVEQSLLSLRLTSGPASPNRGHLHPKKVRKMALKDTNSHSQLQRDTLRIELFVWVFFTFVAQYHADNKR